MKLLRSPLYWLLGIVVAGCVVVALRRRPTLEIPAQNISSISINPLPDAAQPETPLARDTRLVREYLRRVLKKAWIRVILFAAVALGVVWLLFSLKRPYANLLLLTLLLTGAALAVRRVSPAFAPLIMRLRASRLGRWLAHHRILAAQVLTLVAVVSIYASAYIFRAESSLFMLGNAAGLLALGGIAFGMALPLGGAPAFPDPADSQRQLLPRLCWRWLAAGLVILLIWGAVRLVSAPLAWSESASQLLTALKNASAPASGEAQFALMAVGLMLVTLAGVRTRHVPLLAGLLLLLLLAEINGRLYDIRPLTETTTHVQFVLLCLSLSLMVFALGGGKLPRIRWRPTRTALALTVITLVGLALRFWSLEGTVRVLVDELFFTTAIYDLRHNPYVPLLAPYSSISAFPYLFPYFQAHTVELFGRNFTGLRAASAFMGTAMIPLVYWLGKTLFDRKTALLGALLLATSPPHLHFSRLGIIEIGGTLAGLAALALLARAIMFNRRLDYAAAGALLGLTHYFHEGARLLFTPMAALWVIGVLMVHRPRGRIAHLMIAAVMLMIAAAPVYYTLIGMERPLFARMSGSEISLNSAYFTNLFASGDFRNHLQTYTYQSFMVYIRQNDTSLFYGPAPLVTAAALPALLLGVCIALWRWRSAGAMLLILWVVSTSMGNNVLINPANSPRYVVVFPALALLMALGLRWTLTLLARRVEFALLVGLILAGLQVDFYFNQHLPAYNQHFRIAWNHRDAQDAALRSVKFPAGTQIHVVSEKPPAPDYAAGLLVFMRDDLAIDFLAPESLTPQYLVGLDTGVDHAFYVEPEDGRSVDLLRRYFALLPPQDTPYSDVPPFSRFTLYYAPSQPGYHPRSQP